MCINVFRILERNLMEGIKRGGLQDWETKKQETKNISRACYTFRKGIKIRINIKSITSEFSSAVNQEWWVWISGNWVIRLIPSIVESWNRRKFVFRLDFRFRFRSDFEIAMCNKTTRNTWLDAIHGEYGCILTIWEKRRKGSTFSQQLIQVSE
jgi:hypothetical protein